MKVEDWLKSKGEELVCSNCGRKSIGVKESDRCNMPQPSGEKCGGVFKK